MNELSAEMLSVTETMSAIKTQLKEDDMIILQVRDAQRSNTPEG